MTQFVYLLEIIQDTIMIPYSYFIHGKVFEFFTLWFWFDPQQRQGAFCKIWIDFAFQILMTFSESLIQHY